MLSFVCAVPAAGILGFVGYFASIATDFGFVGHAARGTMGAAAGGQPPRMAQGEADGRPLVKVEPQGTDLRVARYPHPALRAPNKEVTEFGEGLEQTLKEMFIVMYADRGVGLAAPQVGINERIMVFNPDSKEKPLSEVSLVNPRITAKSQGTDVDLESCLSFPGLQGKVRRHKWIKVEAQDAAGKKITKKYTGWTARVFQHEFDHLDGVVYIDQLEDVSDQEVVKPLLLEMAREYKEKTGEAGAPELKFKPPAKKGFR